MFSSILNHLNKTCRRVYGYERTRTLNFLRLDSTDGLSEELYHREEIYFFTEYASGDIF